MKLKRFLQKNEMTHQAFATLSGISKSTVNAYSNRRRIPSYKIQLAIEFVTKGAVKAKIDWGALDETNSKT